MLTYKITNKINNSIYIGCTERTIEIRWKQHLRSVKIGSNCKIHAAIREFGQENFIMEQLEIYQTLKEMFDGEIRLIKKFNAFEDSNHYNSTIGGFGGATNTGIPHNEDWKDNMSKSAVAKQQKGKQKYIDVEEDILNMYVIDEKSTYYIEAFYKKIINPKTNKNYTISRTTINEMLYRAKVPQRQSNYLGHDNGRKKYQHLEIKICDDYKTGNFSLSKLAKKYNVSKTNVIRDILKRGECYQERDIFDGKKENK